MDESNGIINSEEINRGKRLYTTAVFLFIPTLGVGASAVINSSAGAAIGFLVLFVISLLLYIFGFFQYKHYQVLGQTPLTLVPRACTLGVTTYGSISIEREEFQKVESLSLTLWQSKSIGGDGSCPDDDAIWETTIDPNVTFDECTTVLDFEFMIPIDKATTIENGASQGKYYGELSFEFVESMERVKRTWKIPVKKRETD